MKTIPAIPGLVPFLLTRMGIERTAALRAQTADNAEGAIVQNIAISTYTWCGLDDDGVVNMGGVIPMPGASGYVWQFITDGIRTNKRGYLEQGRENMKIMLMQYPRLTTIIEADYTAALRHVQRNGWQVGDPQEFGGRSAYQCEVTR